MKKIITLFKRNYDGDHLVRNEVVEGAEWVLAGEGVATRKFDGTCCMVRDGILYRRREIKKGKPVPDNFEETAPEDPKTGKRQGWVPVGDGDEDKYHREAWERGNYFGVSSPDPRTGWFGVFTDGTYELVGPKIQGNPEWFKHHVLVPHGRIMFHDVPRTFEGLRDWFNDDPLDPIYEGIVWHHEDGRRVKIKARDFGFKRPT